MATKVEIGFGTGALVCLAGAADAWLGIGAADGFSGLWTNPARDAVDATAQTETPGTHVSLFLAAGLACLGIAVSSRHVRRFLKGRARSRPEGRARRRLIAALVFVARCCKETAPRDVSDAYHAVTGDVLDRGEIAKAVTYLRSGRAASIEKILARTEDEDEKRRILTAVCRIWSYHGMDSGRATKAMERIAAALGLTGDDINEALDEPRKFEASRVLKNVERLARRTVSRATTGAQRITTRILGAN